MKEKQTDKKRLILELALYINKKLYEEKEISYKMFKYAEQSLIKEK